MKAREFFLRHRRIVAASAIVVVAVVVACLISAASSARSQEQMAKIAAMSAEECLAAMLDGTQNAVVTIGILNDDEENWAVYGEGASELPHEVHAYEIGSLTKTITAVMVAQAVSEGKVSLDAPIDEYIDLPRGKGYPTVADLLTHTAGFEEYYFESPMIGNILAGRNTFHGIGSEAISKKLGELTFTGGDHAWSYSNFGYATLGLLLENVYGEDYETLANGFLEKMGMDDSHISDGTGDLENYWEWAEGDAYLAAGGVVSDVDDMLLYARLLLGQEGVFDDVQQRLKAVDATPDAQALLDMRVDAMGMGWIIDEQNGFVWHNGGTDSYSSYLGFCQKTKTAVVVLSNIPSGNGVDSAILGIKLLKELQ